MTRFVSVSYLSSVLTLSSYMICAQDMIFNVQYMSGNSIKSLFFWMLACVCRAITWLKQLEDFGTKGPQEPQEPQGKKSESIEMDELTFRIRVLAELWSSMSRLFLIASIRECSIDNNSF